MTHMIYNDPYGLDTVFGCIELSHFDIKYSDLYCGGIIAHREDASRLPPPIQHRRPLYCGGIISHSEDAPRSLPPNGMDSTPTVCPTAATKSITLISSALHKEDCEYNELIEVFKYLKRFTTASARGLFDYDLNDRRRNNGAKLITKHFNTSVAQHFYPFKFQQPGMPYQMKLYAAEQRTLSRTAWTNTGQKIPQMPQLTCNNHRCRVQFKCAQTVAGQRFFWKSTQRDPTTYCWKSTYQSVLRAPTVYYYYYYYVYVY